MAQIKSHMHSEMRGTIGGVTYFSGVGHPILARQYFRPTNRNTIYQQRIRAAVQDAVMAWQMIAEADRLLWESYAAAMGESGHGRRWFIAGHSKAQFVNYSGGTIIVGDEGPIAEGLANYVVYDPTGPATPGTGFSVSVGNLEPADSISFQANIAGPFSVARWKYKGPFEGESVKFTTIAFESSGPIEFLGLVEDGVYFCRIRGVTAVATGSAIPHRITSPTIMRAVAEVKAGP